MVENGRETLPVSFAYISLSTHLGAKFQAQEKTDEN